MSGLPRKDWEARLRALAKPRDGGSVYFRRLAGAPCRSEASSWDGARAAFGRRWREAARPESADVIVVDGCNMNPSQNQLFESFSRFALEHPDKTVIFSGCVPAGADASGRPRNFHVAPLDKTASGARKGPDPEPELLPADALHPESRSSWSSFWSGAGVEMDGMRYLLASTGCADKCAFCIVKTFRGGVRSRPLAELSAEHRAALRSGARRFWLLADELGCWGRDLGADLAGLLAELGRSRVEDELHLSSLHPARLAELLPRLEPHLGRVRLMHVPAQSGSDAVLDRMGRGHRARDVRDLVRRLREGRPGLRLTTDILVGFPGETRKDLMDSFELAELFDAAHFIPMKTFSPLPASKLDGRVSGAESALRLALARAAGQRLERHRLGRIDGRRGAVVWVGKGERA